MSSPATAVVTSMMFNVSVPAPPSIVSRALRVLASAEASALSEFCAVNISSPAPPVKSSTPVVNVKLCPAFSGSEITTFCELATSAKEESRITILKPS